MIHIQLDEVKRALPILAEEIRAGRDIIIEDQGQTVAYVQKTQAQKEEHLGSVIQRMRMFRSEFTPGTTAEELSEWINDGRE